MDQRKKMRSIINFSKNLFEAKIPTLQSLDSVGYDLYTTETTTLRPGQMTCVDTGIVFEMDGGYFAWVTSKSRIARDSKVIVDAGVIDPGYRGSVRVLLRNVGATTVTFEKHAAVAQVLFIPAYVPVLNEVESVPSNTERGKRGFGGET